MKRADLHELITANHILHYQNVVDAYGHVSLRHPEEPNIFIMSGDKAPALVSSPSDLIQYRVSDSSPVDPKSKKGYQERFIHSEIYKRFPHINSVIHSHSEAVLPYTMNGVPMQPAYHIAGFLGTDVPMYDITSLYKPEDSQSLLVNSEHFGSVLAEKFSPDRNVVLMANHGFTTVGTSIRQAVYRAVYTHKNAGVQSNGILLRNAYLATSQIKDEGKTGLRYLSGQQVVGCMKMNNLSQDRPWGLWVREVETSPLYVKDIDEPGLDF